MPIDSQYLSSVTERDVDLLLVEELTVSTEFADWMTSRLFGRVVLKEVIGTWHSVSDATLGESDVLFLFRNADDGRVAVLIENKIDAGPQPAQAARYRRRGEKGVEVQDWDAFLTCLVAPEAYLSNRSHADGYDARVSYEEVMAFFVSRRSRDSRYLFKASVIQEAIEKKRRGYVAEISQPMTDYVRDYCRLATALAPECHVQEAKPRPAGSTWVQYRPRLGKSVTVFHQLTAGQAKLFIAGAAEKSDEVLAPFRSVLPPDVEAGAVGKSVALAIAVPRLSPLEKTVAEERDAVEKGVAAVRRLVELYRIV